MVRRVDYSQSVIGDCGHVCAAWPQAGKLGVPGYTVICEVCTREEYGIPDTEVLTYEGYAPVMVYERKQVERAAARKAAPKVKVVRCSICQEKGHLYTSCPLIAGQGVLFDG